ncbi:MAG: hypothetical protein JST89_23840 [Cyanobacteria bacterium SZAS-4]|nr:hypothetical protein [Cyanobacteria bacterium SZAS-4]
MLMTATDLSGVSTEDLMQRKRELENGLATASMHGVELPEALLNELKDTQNELAKRLDFEPSN